MSITSCGASRRVSECPSMACRPGPIYHHIRESIEAHLSIVVAAPAVSPWVEHQTGWR